MCSLVSLGIINEPAFRLPVPSRDEILSSPSGDNMVDDSKQKITASPIDENPAEGFEREIVQRR